MIDLQPTIAHYLLCAKSVARTCIALFIATGITTASVAAEPRYLESGIDNFNFGQLDAAMYEFKHAEALKPNNPTVHYYIASVLSRQNKMEEARDEYQKALSLSAPSTQLAQLCRVAISNIDRQLPVNTGKHEGNSGPKLGVNGQKGENTSEPKITKQEKKPTTGRKTSAEDDDPDIALLKATGGLPPPLLKDEPSNGKKDEALGAKKDEALGAKRDDAQKDTPLSAREVEAECEAIQAAARKRIAKMQAAKVRGENGDLAIYDGEDYEDVQREADAMCAKVRSRLDKKQLTVPVKKGRR